MAIRAEYTRFGMNFDYSIVTIQRLLAAEACWPQPHHTKGL